MTSKQSFLVEIGSDTLIWIKMVGRPYMKKEEFEAQHGKLSENTTYIDLDEQQVPPEPTTAGWTDTQIRAKSLTEIDAMINTGELGLASLKETLDNEVKRVNGLRRIRERKFEL